MQPTRFRHRNLYTGALVAPGGALERHGAGLEVDATGRIVPPGTLGDGARVVDLPGAAVVPGFIDTHLHLNSLGGGPTDLDLRAAAAPSDLLDAVAAARRARPDAAWIGGTGWQDAGWTTPLPDADALDAASGGVPVALFRRDRHALLASRAALRLAGVDAATPNPPGGAITRSPDGRPSGLLVDTAMDLVSAALPGPTVVAAAGEAREKALHLASLGVTCVHEAWTDALRWAALVGLTDAGELPIRVRAMLADSVTEHPDPTRDAHRLRVIAVKGFADGALGSRGAQLSRPYEDADTSGLAVHDDAALRALAERALAWDLALAVHAIGDRAVTRVLDLFDAYAPRSASWRIEHAQMVAPTDLPRVAGRRLAMQPVHGLADGPWAGERLGAERLAWSYRARTLAEAGAHLAFGSDYPIESADPRLGLLMLEALEHPAVPGWDRGAERVDRARALQGYWADAAALGGDEGHLGNLAPGHLADFVCLSEDPSAAADPRAWDVVATWVGGELVYAQPGAEP